MTAIRSPFITVQPRSIAPEGDQVRERKLVIIEISHYREEPERKEELRADIITLLS